MRQVIRLTMVTVIAVTVIDVALINNVDKHDSIIVYNDDNGEEEKRMKNKWSRSKRLGRRREGGRKKDMNMTKDQIEE